MGAAPGNATTSNATPWTLEQGVARLVAGPLTGSIGLLRPSAGLHALAINGRSLAATSLLEVGLPDLSEQEAATRCDGYARADDLIATYAAHDGHPLRWQIYWRHESARYRQAISAIEMVASVQTHLLDTHPELSCSSRLPAREFEQLGDARGPIGCFLFRLRDAPFCYAEMVHPADHQDSQVVLESSNSGPAVMRIRHRLFARRLEKGVILRSRVLGLWLPADVDLAGVARHYARFVDAEPPLTT